MISAERVSLLPIDSRSESRAESLAETCRPQVPKFQGENFYKNRAIVEEIKKLATRKGCKITQIALAWVAAQGMIPIPGTTKAQRLEENWASRDIDLTEEEMREMRKIVDSAKPVGNRYPPKYQAMVGH
jgi:aryl-alcohol dehydrogenase-like predicted oxidoreductase